MIHKREKGLRTRPIRPRKWKASQPQPEKSGKQGPKTQFEKKRDRGKATELLKSSFPRMPNNGVVCFGDEEKKKGTVGLHRYRL